MAVYGGSMTAVGEALMHARNTFLPLWLGVFLFLYEWSQVGHSQRHGPPEVAIPLKVTVTGVGVKPGDWQSYSLHFGGQKQVVHVKVNKLFLSRHLPVFTYSDQGALLEDQPFVQNDCYYHGYVEGDPESLVALSTCSGGFQGILQTNDIVYEIEPKRPSATFEHLIYKVDDKETQFPHMRCGLTDEEIARQLKFQESVKFTLMQSGYEGWWTHRRFLELAVVVDHDRYLHRQSNTTVVQSEVYLVVNEIDNFLSSLDIDVVLIGIEIWTERNLIPTDTIQALLGGFCLWKKNSFNDRLPHDVAHVFVKRYYGIAVGLAYVGKVCDLRYNCGVDSFMTDDLHDFAYIVSHEIGHNLGMDHDSGTCECGHKTCIMYPAKASATRFSNCSYAAFMNTIATQDCLYVSSNTGNVFTLTQCGNRVVEEGEECDCGDLELCTKDPCCQSSCTLRPGAACAFGLCCQDCQIMPIGTVCRQEENACDLPEWCNGTSYHCPEDVYVQNGIPCKDGGYCYEKRCNNREEQCREIFGKEARSAHQGCYTKMNTQGDRFGNCGIHGSVYKQCNVADVLCGRVQCENVAEIPLLRDHSTVHWTHFNGVTCWGTDYHLGMTTPDIGDVKDGTECDAERVCVRRKCVHRSLLVAGCSPETCNMKGVCNNKNNCHCNQEWAPPTCLTKGHGGSVDSGPPPEGKIHKVGEKKNYLQGLWLIFLIIPLCFILAFMKFKRTEKSEDLPPPTLSVPPPPKESQMPKQDLKKGKKPLKPNPKKKNTKML